MNTPLNVRNILLLCVLTLTLGATVSHAALDVFLKIDGIDGEATDTDHKDWINLLSYNVGIQNSLQRPGAPGLPTASEFMVTKELDKSTPVLAEACCQGRMFDEVVIQIVRTVQNQNRIPFMEYKLTHVFVTSVQTGMQAEGEPTEQLSLNFEKIEWTYTPVDVHTGAPMHEIHTQYDFKPIIPQ